MFKKTVLGVVFSFGLISLFSTRAFAAVDISLEDDTENKQIAVTVNSNDEYLDGVDLNIKYSGVTVNATDITQTEDFCTMAKSVEVADNTVSIECFNDSGTTVDGVLATIPYTVDSSDYYFYVDTDSLDLGSRTLGEVVDINKPVDSTDTEDTTTQEETSLTETVINFVSDNYFYLACGALLVIALVVVIAMLTGKKEEVQESPVTTAPVAEVPVTPVATEAAPATENTNPTTTPTDTGNQTM